MTIAELRAEYRRLPFAERVELLGELWREAENQHPELIDWQRELLDQRVRDAEARSRAQLSTLSALVQLSLAAS